MNTRAPFHRNDWPTLGVEIELQLVDAETMALRSAFGRIASSLPGGLRDGLQPEFMQCCAEIVTGVCRTVADVEADLTAKILAVEEAAAREGVRLFWAGTHPFSGWRAQQITPDARYHKLAAMLQDSLVRSLTFGLHVHVGVESGDAAIQAISRIRRELPLLLALSANSPFWNGRWTGHHAHRIEVQASLPTGGLPPRIHSWYEYLELVDRLRAGGFIETPKELWWEVRPNAAFGTVEVRICDMPPDLPSVLALTALIQCLVHRASRDCEPDSAEHEIEALFVQQNRWRACRYGLGAQFVEPMTLDVIPARKAIEKLIGLLRADAAQLGCERWLEHALDMAWRPGGSERQLDLFERTDDMADVVRECVEQSSLRPASNRKRVAIGFTATEPLACSHFVFERHE